LVRHLASNPDLPNRLEYDLRLAHYDRSTSYVLNAHGYTDFPTCEKNQQKALA
jgi:hypothetical protein